VHLDKVDAKKTILIPKIRHDIQAIVSKLKKFVPIDRIVIMIIVSQLVVASVKDVVANPTCWLAVSNTA
jgi:hypothetical protein